MSRLGPIPPGLPFIFKFPSPGGLWRLLRAPRKSSVYTNVDAIVVFAVVFGVFWDYFQYILGVFLGCVGCILGGF